MDMKIGKDFILGQVWIAELSAPKGIGPAEYNREIRNWLARNIGSESWETSLTGIEFTDVPRVRVTFDIDAEEDAMAFKLRWS